MNWRDNVRKTEPYVPGEQPKVSGTIIKLNTNENPYPPSPKVKAVLDSINISDYRLYPDTDAAPLTAALADYYGVKPENVFVGVGSDDVLAMSFLTFFNSEKDILFSDITYSFYKVWAELYNIPYSCPKLDDEFNINPDDYIPGGYLKENGGIVIANPNAPTSVAMKVSDIEKIIAANRGSVVIVDEAYIDFGGESVLPLVDRYDNLLVVRTFSKSRSMAGVRIGFAIGNEELISALKAIKNSYNSYTMNMSSILLGNASIEDDKYFKDILNKIIKTRDSFVEKLTELGFDVLPSSANFVFAKHKSVSAKFIFEELKKKNIFVRYFDKPRINDRLRITIGTEEEMAALVKELAELL